jgi:hypothetical protein
LERGTWGSRRSAQGRHDRFRVCGYVFIDCMTQATAKCLRISMVSKFSPLPQCQTESEKRTVSQGRFFEIIITTFSK